jgi:hypothetical protein
VAQDEELRGLKERMLGGAPVLPGMTGSGAAARNKMLIRGGSSFNALVRRRSALAACCWLTLPRCSATHMCMYK